MVTSKVILRHDTAELLPVKSLQVFLAVLDEGSMTAAARSLNLTQPAVSMVISDLEETLNRDLIDRSVRPLRPTTAGRVLADRSRKLVVELQEIRLAMEASGSMVLPSLRVGLISSATAAGALAIKEMRSLARELIVSSSALTPDLVVALRGGLKDVLVVSDPMEDFEGIERHLILREPLVVVTPKGLGAGADLERLASRLPMVHYTAKSRLGAIIEQYLRKRGLRVARTLEFDTSAFFFPIVAASLGWAITTPLCILESKVDLEQLDVVPLEGQDGPARELYAVAGGSDLAEVAGKVAEIFRRNLEKQVRTAFRGERAWLAEALTFAGNSTPAR